jgi:3-oxoacyl-[acyl-carrier-protein] synthase-1
MENVFIKGTNIYSPLGITATECAENVFSEKSGISLNKSESLSPKPILTSHFKSGFIDEKFSVISNGKEYTKFEKLAILSIKEAIQKTNIDLNSERTIIILSTTKGNIDLLEKGTEAYNRDRLKLQVAAQEIADFFRMKTRPIIVSNACISGIAAQVVAKRLIAGGKYDNVIVNGTDLISRFVVAGFQSFYTISENPCKPFDKNRDGLTLGEGSATIVLSSEKSDIELINGATSNDANHISGPSRTGEGLLVAINQTMGGQDKPSFISAHGTGTQYNDDMESVAISRAGLSNVPVNSMKGYFGHTLGAAGVIETVIAIEALKQNKLIKSLNCEIPGTVEKINISLKTLDSKNQSFLKLGSGFGGCNAAILYKKYE